MRRALQFLSHKLFWWEWLGFLHSHSPSCKALTKTSWIPYSAIHAYHHLEDVGMVLALLEQVSMVQLQWFVYLRLVLTVAAETSVRTRKTELWIILTASLSANYYLTYNYTWPTPSKWVRLKTDHNRMYSSAWRANLLTLHPPAKHTCWQLYWCLNKLIVSRRRSFRPGINHSSSHSL